MSKRVTLDDDEIAVLITWLKNVANPPHLDGHYYMKKWSELAVRRLLAKLEEQSDD